MASTFGSGVELVLRMSYKKRGGLCPSWIAVRVRYSVYCVYCKIALYLSIFHRAVTQLRDLEASTE